jgi:hypothetical protein
MDRSEIPEEYLNDDELLALELMIARRKKYKPKWCAFYGKYYEYIKENHRDFFDDVWSFLHYLAERTKNEGHDPYKDYLKDEAFKLLKL